jgi:hypothetical protein
MSNKSEMSDKHTFIIFIVIGLALVLILCQKQILENSSLSSHLPEQIGGWITKGEPLVYEGDDLFLYINGGAEIYHEYGFDRVIVQDYTDRDSRSITLEVYEMKSPGGAFGIYTFKRSPEGETVKIGSDACLEGYFLNFWSGNVLVTLTGFQEDEETTEGLMTLAHFVAERIDNSISPPHLVSLLPDENLIQSSIKYFKGYLGLFNNSNFFEEDVFAVREGIKGDYSSGLSVFIFKYDQSIKSSEVHSQAVKRFNDSHRYTDIQVLDRQSLKAKNKKGQLVMMQSFAQYILIVVGTESYALIQRKMNQLIQNVNTAADRP